MRRVAIIGGGIAGFGCAWALQRAGLEATVYEREPTLGGNAKTWTWDVSGRAVTTGLSVLAWPRRYFHNYERLLEELRVPTEPTPPLRFFVKSGRDEYAHGVETAASRRFADDLARWERAVATIRKTNAFFAGRSASEPGSLYETSATNPLNITRLRDLLRATGVSQAFWDKVFVPIHSSSFLAANLDGLPASIAPVLEDIVSLRSGGELITWTGCSRDVFDAMSRGFEGRVHRGRKAIIVRRRREQVEIADVEGALAAFDAVVFACNARDACDMLEAGGSATSLERWLLGGIAYPDDEDRMFQRGVIHSDPEVLPADRRREILAGFANYVEHVEGTRRYENTFVISSWVPAARGCDLPMLVSYNREGPIERRVGAVDNTFAHPALTPSNLARAFALRSIQGRDRTYYCGSYTTPGNGHDLSLLSGFVVAGALGAPYPFFEHEIARRDYARLTRWMLGRATASKRGAHASAAI